MIEQWYAVHKTTGQIFKSSANSVCFNTKGGLITAINTKEGEWRPKPSGTGWYLTDTPVDKFLIKKVELT